METKIIQAIDGDSILVDHWTTDTGKDAVCIYARHSRATVIVALKKDQARELAAALLEFAA